MTTLPGIRSNYRPAEPAPEPTPAIPEPDEATAYRHWLDTLHAAAYWHAFANSFCTGLCGQKPEQ